MNLELTATPEVLRERFIGLVSKEDVARLLELSSYSFLAYLLYVLPPEKRYRSFYVQKRNGGQRLIQEPTPNLKIVQQRLNQVLSVVYSPRKCVQGFVSGRSIATNASHHVHRRYVLNLDLKDFFPSINYWRVRGMFRARPHEFNDEVANLLAQIVSLPAGLPQGAPTSPVISNMLCSRLDSELQRLARESHCYYTRYADDITFSTSLHTFPTQIAQLDTERGRVVVAVGDKLQFVIHSNHFRINEAKLRLQTSDRRQVVTGLVTNRKVNVNRAFVRNIRAMLHTWETLGLDAAEQRMHELRYRQPDKPYKQQPDFRHVLKGKLEYVAMAKGHEDPVFVKLHNKAAGLEQRDGLVKRLFWPIISTTVIEKLIEDGECETVEFKEAAMLSRHSNLGKHKPDQDLKKNVLEAVAGMLNGPAKGYVLIGVADNGEVIGVEREYETANPNKPTWDGYALSIGNYLRDKLSGKLSDPMAHLDISQQKVGEKAVCLISTRRAPVPVLVHDDDRLFVRRGNAAPELKGQDKVDFIQKFSKPASL